MSTELTPEEWKKLAEHYYALLDDNKHECGAAWTLAERWEKRACAALKILYTMNRETGDFYCCCDAAIGHPLYSDHSPLCKSYRRFMESASEWGGEHVCRD